MNYEGKIYFPSALKHTTRTQHHLSIQTKQAMDTHHSRHKKVEMTFQRGFVRREATNVADLVRSFCQMIEIFGEGLPNIRNKCSGSVTQGRP